MANKIKLKRGLSSKVSSITLDEGEIVLTTDTNKLYTNKGQISPDNVYVGDTEPTDSNVKCWISPSGKIDLSSLWDQIYPVGSIYITVNATNPSVLFGGTWEQIKDRFLLGAGDNYAAGNTGGEETHVLTNNELPKVTGSFQSRQTNDLNILDVYGDDGCFSYTPNGGDRWKNQISGSDASANNNALITFDNGGKNQAHNNMPPYLAVYVWKRTA